MKEIKKAIIRLLGVRTIITLSLTAALIYGFVVGKVETKDFLVYLAMAFTYFFAKENIDVKREQEVVEDKKPTQEEQIDMSKGVG